MSPERLFHLLPVDRAEEFLGGQADWTPASLSSEGFVHLSFAHQLASTLETHYANVEEMTLLELSAESAAPELRLEASRGGADFPHLYRAVARADVLRSWRLTRARSGWILPDLDAGAAT